MNRKLKDNVKEFKGYGESVARITMRINGRTNLAIIQVYAPTSSHDDEEIDAFYEVLNKEMSEIKQSGTDYMIIMGDFNARMENN